MNLYIYIYIYIYKRKEGYVKYKNRLNSGASMLAYVFECLVMHYYMNKGTYLK
jgi:hypothetical protein